MAKKSELQTSKEYLNALAEAKNLIVQSQERFLRSVNRMSMEVRLKLGKIIEENSVKYDWGKSVLKTFSEDLSILFPDNTGFSERNLSSMRQFYSEYKEHPELLSLAMEVSWGVNIIIMNKVKATRAKLYYLQMAAETMCSRDAISTQIAAKAYEKGHLQDKKHNFHATLPAIQASKAESIIKGRYLFEATEPLGLTNQLQEKQLEDDMVRRIKEVIMMLGRGFSFIGNQYLINAGNNSYRIDLLFFNALHNH